MFESIDKKVINTSTMDLKDQPVDVFTKGIWNGNATHFESAQEVIHEQGISEFSERTIGSLMRTIEPYLEVDEEIHPSPVRDLIYNQDVTLGALVGYSDLVSPHARDTDVGNSLEYFDRPKLEDSDTELYRHVLECVLEDQSNNEVKEAVTPRLERLNHIVSSPEGNALIKKFEENRDIFKWATTGESLESISPILPKDTSVLTYVLLSHAAESGPPHVKFHALQTLRNVDMNYESVVEDSLKKRGKF
jgi:hypothetical protein